jgi:thiol-disulfide isomerase/thioredoxin
MIRKTIWGLVFALAVQAQTTNIVPAVRKAAFAKDVATAERLVAEYRAQRPELTLPLLEAISWVGRGASFAKQWDTAEKYAREALEGSEKLLATRKLDAEPGLPLALGAAIEVLGAVQDGRGDRGAAVTFLREQHAKYKGTSIETRIQKNINLLTLEGKPAPEFGAQEWVGEKGKSLKELRGKVVVAFFWAHWCGDCKRQFPDLVKLQEAFGSRGLVIVGPTQLFGYISRGQDATPAQELAYLRGDYQKRYPIPEWMAAPVGQENFLKFGVSTTPTLMLVDRKGIVRLYHPGTLPYEELAGRVGALLGS